MSLFINHIERDNILRKSGTFWFGKYKDLLVEPILESEPSYVIWLSEQEFPWLSIDPQLLQEANELYDKAEGDNDYYVAPQNDAMTDDWWNWK